MTDKSENAIDVFYDGECPVCQMEVRYYRRIQEGDTIRWIDILQLDDDELPDGKTREGLLGKFHVREADGSWHVGIDAFARIWRNLPGWRHFSFLFRVPVLRQAAGAGYRGFLKWQRWHRRHRRLDSSHHAGAVRTQDR